MGRDLIALLDGAWKDWLLAVDLVPRDRYCESGVCGPWSVKDLVGHVALWDSEVLTDIDRWHVGVPFLRNDWEQMNQDDHAAKAERPFDLLRVEMNAAHQAIRSVLAGIDDSIDGEILERIAVDTWDHYPEHTAQIRAWIAGG